MTAQQFVAEHAFGTVSDLIRAHAREQPGRPALADAHGRLDYAALDARMDRIAAALQRDGLGVGDAIAFC
ncbi:AMP-binding protein, partial [Pseudacidovorax intermedius]|uniref:AMP-binding protein n=1 Tax=Pseudacidovorax intermedius TaxID=433924 RepID=UPI0005B9326A